MDDELQVEAATGLVLGDRYRVDTVLGQGGMGLVAKGVQINTDREVAIKLLLPRALENPNTRQRFEREMKAMSKLDHPHVVRLLDWGEDAGHSYLVMELLAGNDLKMWIRRLGRVPVAQAIKIVLQLLDGLQAAHDAGLVHRDLKPANIFLAETDDAAFTVKILDFGAVLGEDEEGPRLTQKGGLLGTPGYIAPELIKGRDVTAAVDLYGAGIVLLEMIGGRKVYMGVDPMTILQAQLKTKARIPKYVDDPELRRVMAKAVEPKPRHRYESATEFAEDLEAAFRQSKYHTSRSGPRPPVIEGRMQGATFELPPEAVDALQAEATMEGRLYEPSEGSMDTVESIGSLEFDDSEAGFSEPSEVSEPIQDPEPIENDAVGARDTRPSPERAANAADLFYKVLIAIAIVGVFSLGMLLFAGPTGPEVTPKLVADTLQAKGWVLTQSAADSGAMTIDVEMKFARGSETLRVNVVTSNASRVAAWSAPLGYRVPLKGPSVVIVNEVGGGELSEVSKLIQDAEPAN